MSNNKSLNLTQFRRISLLITYLKRNPFKTKQEILDYFEENDKSFNERTFYRLKQTLDYDFGILITFDYSKNGYYFDEEKSINADTFLSLLEIVVTAELFSTNLKLNNTLNYIEFENKATIEGLSNFKIILKAIQQNVSIKFKHYSFYHLKENEYTIIPYFLKQYQNRWYVIGETEKGYRTFGIDRIENILVNTKKIKPKTEEAKDKFSHVIGLNYVDHKLEKIRLSFHNSQKPYLQSLPLHHSQKEIPSDIDATFTIELLIHPNFEFNQQILKYGSLVKVLEPKWLVDEIMGELEKAVEKYK